MRLTLFLMAILSTVASCFSADPAAGEITVQATGLRIVANDTADTEDRLRPFNWHAGTTIALLISAPAGGFVQFDHKNSALTKFTDDKGNDLTAKPKKEAQAFGTPGFSLFPNMSADGKACAIEVTGASAPAKGAATIKLEGVLTMLCGSTKKEYEQKDVPFKTGSKITADKTELTIEKTGKPAWGDEPLGLTLRSHNSELDEVAEIKFFKADGKEITAKRQSTSKMGILGAMTVDWDFVLSEKVDAATVKVYLWSDLQKKKVPFSLNVDVGL